MIKEFVPYELAVKLKELGFDEPCLFAFDNCSTPMRCSDLRTNEQQFNGVNYNSSTYTSQPTFSQAFRWFREKGYRFNAINDVSQVDGDYFYDVWFNGKFLFESHESSNTYEEAELACLTKLIEIVEQINQK